MTCRSNGETIGNSSPDRSTVKGFLTWPVSTCEWMRKSSIRSQSGNARIANSNQGKSMNTNQIIRAWKDSSYRASLTEAERAQLPGNPAGIIELKDKQIKAVTEGFGSTWYTIWIRPR
jgi:mersacidin/lichenicidin family type 2 lantibiotic